jgi:hypothetical protein
MKCSIGDNVRFKLESGEVQEGNVQFVEKGRNEATLYVNGFCRWAYKVPENRVISRVPLRYKY